MRSSLAIFRREFASYFNSPIAYIFIIAFLVLNAGLFMTGFFLNGAADLRAFFGNLPFFLIFFIPAVSMRLWAEDKRLGTFELLMTLPMRASDVMLGKYLAALAFYLVALAGTLTLPIMVGALGNPDTGRHLQRLPGRGAAGRALPGHRDVHQRADARPDLGRDPGHHGLLPAVRPGHPRRGGHDRRLDSGAGLAAAELPGPVRPTTTCCCAAWSPLGDLAYFLGLTAVFLVLNALWLEGRKY